MICFGEQETIDLPGFLKVYAKDKIVFRRHAKCDYHIPGIFGNSSVLMHLNNNLSDTFHHNITIYPNSEAINYTNGKFKKALNCGGNSAFSVNYDNKLGVTDED